MLMNWTVIVFPMQMKDLVKFETQNGISVNVFDYEKRTVYPIHLPNQRFERHVDLLMIPNGQRSYYFWIKNFNQANQ